MSSIQDLFQQAQLAEAAYAIFLNNSGNLLTDNDEIKVALIASGFSKDQNNPTQSAQATAFLDQWRIVDQYTAPDVIFGLGGTGFSGTLFQNISTGAYTFSLRGTAGLTDLSADAGDVLVDGIALDQIVDMYNYWQSLTHAGVYQAKQLMAMATETLALNAAYAVSTPAGLAYESILRARTDIVIDYPGRTVRAIQSVDSTQLSDARLQSGSGVLAGATNVNVEGHSLGGHLAMAFSRLFPDVTNEVTAVNGAGFNFANTNVKNLFAMLGGTPGFDASKITNVVGSAAMNLVSQDWLFLQQPAGRNEIYTESYLPGSGTTLGHGAGQMTDSLAVYDLFIKLSVQIRSSAPPAALAALKPLFEASSAQAEASLERVVDALVNLFGLDFPPLVDGRIGNREELYQRITPLRALIEGLATNNPGMHVDVLTTATAVNLALLASGSEALAYRYALKELNPFAIVGDNSLYAIHNQNGELNLYNSAQRRGGLSQAWLQDRTQMLAYANMLNTNDARSMPSNDVTDQVRYTDLAKTVAGAGGDFVVHLLGGTANFNGPNTRRITFGGDSGNYLQGRDNTDRLYGEGGSDYLQGNKGGDYLEGGRGMDVYEYNGRNSITSTNSNDGEDVILDTDGHGVLRYVFNEEKLLGSSKSTSTIIRDASNRISGTQWNSADGKFTYQRSGADLVVTVNGDVSGQVTLKDFKEGDFGIYLFDGQRDAQQTTTKILGDKKYLNVPGQQTQRKLPNGDPISFTAPDGSGAVYERLSDPTPAEWLNVKFAPGSGYTLWKTSGGISYYILPITLSLLYNEVDDFGNIKRTDEDQPDFADQLYDTPGNDNLIAGGGNDNIDALRGGADVISAGTGRDVVSAGAGNDLVEGGADGTVVLGLSGLVAGGDMVAGGAGDDEIYGNTKMALSLAIKNGETDVATNAIGDFLSGEAGNDWMVGGKGNDALLGGDGDDILVGGAGNDNLFGDRNHTAPNAAWLITRQVMGDASSGFIYKTLLADINMVADGAGGRDVLYGGAGDDWAFGGKADDFIDGGSGKDVLFGEEGSDVVIGGNDDDILAGDGATVAFEQQGDDFLDGGAGKDQIFGYGGDDVLIGDAGDDILSGGEGNDILIGGTGLDQLFGGAGKDTYVFNRGDGTEIIVDTANDAKSQEASVVVLGDGISRSDIKFRKGSLMVDLGPSNPDDPLAGNDQIHFTSFNNDFPNLTAAIGEIRFADGSSMDYADILAQGFDVDGTAFDDAGGTALIGTSVTDRIRGFAGSDALEGRDGDDVLTGDGGSDQLDGGNGNDVLDGGANSDFLAGGMGSDDYRFIRGDGLDTLVEGSLFVPGLSDSAHTDRIVFGEDITRAEVSLLRSGDGNLTVRYGNGDEILVEGQYRVSGSEIERIVFADGQVITKAELDALEIGVVDGTADADEIYGTAGNDVLRGQDGDDYLDGGPAPERRTAGARLITGDDVLDGGAGGDTYALYWGMGTDRIIDAVDGQTNTLALLDSVTLDSVSTSRDGDDLQVAIRGLGGNARIQGFFTDGGAASWQIASAAEGSQSLLDFYEAQSTAENTHVVNAMADYKQQLLGEWRAQSEPDINLPTHVYIRSTWTQTISRWTALGGVSPYPVWITVTSVNDPVEHTSISGFGARRGGRIVGLPLFDNMVTQRLVAPVVTATISDDAFIAAEFSPDISTNSTSYTFNAGGGGPFSNLRTYSTANGFVANVVIESSVEGWATLNLRTDGVGQFHLTVHQTLENPVIEEITAGTSNNTILGVLENEGNHVALIDAGAGDDVVTAGRYDFVFGNDGDDRITGGAYAFGGNGFDNLSGARFMAGGADDDFLSGGEGETTFSFRSDEAGWDWVKDQNGISLNEFAVKAGIVDSYSNLLYGGKYRYLNSDFALSSAFSAWALRNSDWHGFATESLGDERWSVPNSDGFPRGVADRFARELAPGWGDGYYTWVYNSIEDMMRDFADLGIPFNLAEVQFIPEVTDLLDFTADNHAALQPFFESGVLEKDTVELAGFQEGVDELKIGFVSLDEYGGVNRVLRLVWGEDKVIDIELPSATDLIGHGIEEVRYGGGSAYIGDLVNIAQEEGFLGTPFDDYLVGTEGDDRVRGLAGWDYIEGGAGNDILSGGIGTDEFFFDEGAGSDTILDPDSEDIIEFGDGITSDQLRLGLGSLRLGYGSGGDEIHFQGFNADDVYGNTLFSSLQFWDFEQGEELPDGTSEGVWTLREELTYEQALSRGFDITGTAENDVLRGTNIQDRFEGGAGNDMFAGGAGGDSYFFSTGDGVDTINDFFEIDATNKVVLRDFTADEITGFREGGYVVLRASATSDEIRIQWDQPTGIGVDFIEFSDGSSWDRNALGQLQAAHENTPPVIGVPMEAQTVAEDTIFNFVVPENSFIDDDTDDVLAYSAAQVDGSALPSWLSFDPLTHTFSGTPANLDIGTLRLAVTATDRSGSAVSSVFELAVENVNDAPVYVPPIGDQLATEDAVFTFTVNGERFAEIDAGDVLSYGASLAGGEVLPEWLSFDAITQTFSGIPRNADVGTLFVAVTATDPVGASAAGSFIINVENTNDAPTLIRAIANQVTTENSGFNYAVPADTFLDVDSGDSLAYSAGLANGGLLPAWLSFNATTRVLSGTPPDGVAGELALRIAATDRAGARASADFTLLVEADDAGVIVVGTQASESLTGTIFDDFIDGRGGNDVLHGLAGNDLLIGGAGADHLLGGAGEDILDGRRGQDVLKGGKGADTYLFGRGYGKDVIEDDGAAGEIDAVLFGDGIALRDLLFTKDNGDLTISISGASDRLTIRDWSSRKGGVEVLRFSNGQSVDLREAARYGDAGAVWDQGNNDADHHHRDDAGGHDDHDSSNKGGRDRAWNGTRNEKDFRRLIDSWFDERHRSGDALLSWLDESRDGSKGVKEPVTAIRAGWEASERWLNDHQHGGAGRSENTHDEDFSGLPWLSGRALEAKSGMGINNLPALDGHSLKPFKGLEEGLRVLG
jgi:Ca2+-binding RTX toxin-like protein